MSQLLSANGRSPVLVFGPPGVVVLAVVASLLPASERPVTVQLQLTLDLRAVAILLMTLVPLAFLLLRRLAISSQNTSGIAASAEPSSEQQKQKRRRELEPEKEETALPVSSALAAEVARLPEELLRSLLLVSEDGLSEEAQQRLECPVCHDHMLLPRQTKCHHHACQRCLKEMLHRGLTVCPTCNVAGDLRDTQPPSKEVVESLEGMQCRCAACMDWKGSYADFRAKHVLSCDGARGAISLRLYRLASDAEERRSLTDLSVISKLYDDMKGASPSLVHRIPAVTMANPNSHWSSPLFQACGLLWNMRMGPIVGAPGSRYFCLLAHRHTDRLQCSLVFARKPGDGYKERVIHDWPLELAGQPWGPTIPGAEVQQYIQADGSLLFMVHALGLGIGSEALPQNLVSRQLADPEDAPCAGAASPEV